MDSGPSTKHHDPAPIKVRAPRLAGIQFSEDSVTNELRTLFLREVERATPEVLEKLRQKVWPEYIKAYEAIQQSGFTPTSVLFPSRSAARQKAVVDCSKAVVDWAKEVRLLYGDGPPTWVVQQVETTLQIWTRHPDWMSKGARWWLLGGYKWERRRPQDYLIELPHFTWYWPYGYESARDAKKRILDAVTKIVNARLDEMKKAIKELPRVPTKSRPEHFTWAVLHQIRGVRFEDLAKQSGVALATVKNVVTALKAEIGISLPKGRPKKT